MLQWMGKKEMKAPFLLAAIILLLVFALIFAAILVSKIRYRRQRKTLERLLGGYQADLALVRYVMLNRQCSEEVAYRRIATFIKEHVPLDDQSYVDEMLARNKQSLLEKAHEILLNNSSELEKI